MKTTVCKSKHEYTKKFQLSHNHYEKKKEKNLKKASCFVKKYFINPILKTKLENQKFSNYFKAIFFFFFFETLVFKFWFAHYEQGNRGKLHISVSMQQQAPDLKIDLLSESSEANSPYSPSRSLTGLTIIKSNLSDFLPFGSKQAEKTKKLGHFVFHFWLTSLKRKN